MGDGKTKLKAARQTSGAEREGPRVVGRAARANGDSGNEAYQWWAPGTVVNCLWGDAVTRLASSVWRSELGMDGPGLEWPPLDVAPERMGDLEGYPLWGEDIQGNDTFAPLERFRRRLVAVSFGSEGAFQEYVEMVEQSDHFHGGLLSKARAVLDYYDIDAVQAGGGRHMKLRVIRSESYDFILYPGGLDLFIPPKPYEPLASLDGATEEELHHRRLAARQEIYRMFKFRDAGRLPIALPSVPATGKSDHLVVVAHAAASTGASQANVHWLTAMLRLATPPRWWLTGAVYRAILEALPRIIASMWYEQTAWADFRGDARSYSARFMEPGGLKELIEERLETKLPDAMEVRVGSASEGADREGWNPRDLMITNEGIVVPDPGPAPDLAELLESMERGVAGNPVFTASWPCS